MNNTEWLKQLKVGDKVCVNNEKIGHVVKITKTMVVLGSGRRFNIKSGWQTGNNLYGSSYIEPLTDEKIIELKKKHIRIVAAYKRLWESINGTGSWDLNPFVWVVEFKVLEIKK